MKIMVAYDGTLQSKEALVYGMEKAREKGGEVVALHVFNSPLFMDYDATVNARSVAQAEAARFVTEAREIIREKSKGVKASLYSTDGNPEEEVISFAKAEKVDVLLCPPKYRTIIGRYQKALAESELAGEASKMNVAAFSVNSRTM
jgi:nucleotide-binding universal stress UspA family protein